jgi:hypothetical protein
MNFRNFFQNVAIFLADTVGLKKTPLSGNSVPSSCVAGGGGGNVPSLIDYRIFFKKVILIVQENSKTKNC